MMELEELKDRAKTGDRQALQELRNRGFFQRKRAAKEGYALSHAQKRLWVLEQMEDTPWAYNMASALVLEGPLDIAIFQEAMRAIVNRHEALRTIFVTIRGEPRQIIHEEIDFQIEVTDLSHHSEPLSLARDYVLQEANSPFNLTKGLLLRAKLLKVAQERYVFFFNIHHIVCDAWSMDVLVQELVTLYGAFIKGNANPLPPLRVQYKDYAAWQNALLESQKMEVHRQYWHGKFSDNLSLLQLPTDYPRPPVRTFHGNTLFFTLDVPVSTALEALGRQHQASLFMTLLALVKALLYRYTGQGDIVVGTPVAARDQADLEHQIGFYVNTLALRDKLSSHDGFIYVLEKVKNTVQEAIEHQIYPFDRLVDDLHLDRDMSRSALFDVMVLYQPNDAVDFRLGNVRVGVFDTGFHAAKFDLTFDFTKRYSGICFSINYNTDLFQETKIQRMAEHLKQLALRIVQDSTSPVQGLDILSEIEKNRVLVEFNNTKAQYAQDKSLMDIFEDQVQNTPSNIGVVFEEGPATIRTLTYSELNDRANEVAWHLKDRCGIGAGAMVAVLLDPSDWMVISLLGILKAGSAYVPIDPSYPIDRIRYMLQDSGAQAVLTEHRHAALVYKCLSGMSRDKVVMFQSIESKERSNFSRTIDPDDAAYAIYTSGSTGRPKGCVITHRNVVRLMKNDRHCFDFNEKDVWVIAHSFCFDFSVWEMYGALLYGGQVVVARRDDVRDAEAFLKLLKRHRITVLNQTPAAFYNLIEVEGRSQDHDLHHHLRYVIFGGDRLEPSYLRPWIERYSLNAIQLINMYGITETTVHVTFYRLKEEDILGAYGRSPIGAALPETTVYVCNEAMALQPIGVAGELYVGGTGVSRGYLNQPEVTAERFIASPFHPQKERLYRTGDLGKWLEDGTLEYLGRNDSQVQIRGFRVELGEIEQCLVSHDGVKNAVVLPHETPKGVQELTAYLVGSPPLNEKDLYHHLRNTLPEYMVPSRFVLLDSIPLTSNGKVDKQALSEQAEQKGVDLASGRLYDSPRSPVEQKLAEIWSTTLAYQDIGINDNFFERGGHSLKAAQVVSKIYSDMYVKISLRDMFQFPTIAQLAHLIQRKRPSLFVPIESIALADHYNVSHGQRRLWILEQMAEVQNAYHIPAAILLEGDLNTGALQHALATLIGRHESLRTTFIEIDGSPYQKVHPNIEFHLDVVVVGQEERLTVLIEQEAQRPFFLKDGPLFQAKLFRLSEKRHIFFFNIHHIISDGWSMDILVHEMAKLYSAYAQNKGNPLTPLAIQYKDYAAWQNRFLNSPQGASHRDYWLKKLSGHLPVLELPTDEPRPSVQSFQGDALEFTLESKSTEGLKQLAHAHGASLFMVCLSLVKVLLYRYTGQQDIIIGSPTAGREHPDLSSQVGFYVNMLALRDTIEEDGGFIYVLEKVKDTVIDALEHQAYPFDQLVEELQLLRRDMERSPLFDVVVAMDNETTHAPAESITVSPLAIQTHTSKFDLAFHLTDRDQNGLNITIEYCTALFSRERIDRMVKHFQELVKSVLKAPFMPVKELNILPSLERHNVLVAFNDTACQYPRHQSITSLFEQQVVRVPNSPAAICGDTVLTYRQLNELANRIATYLLTQCSLEPEELVAVVMDRSEWTIVALTGILKGGGAYLPIDPSYPSSRIAYILKDTNCRVVISEEKYINSLLSNFPNINLIDIKSVESTDLLHPETTGTGSSLAYVIYTSGSTGLPKGVLINQRSVIRLILNTNYITIKEDDRILQTGSLAFDASTFEIWGALLNGACVCLPEENTLIDTKELKRLIQRHGITVMFLTTSLFNQLVEGDVSLFRGLQTLLTGGEKVSVHHFNKFRQSHPSVALSHVYGPTENTTFTTAYKVEKPFELDIPIGAPVANSTVYILDKNKQPLPVGIPGEICTGGDGVARGYLNQPAFTEEKFVPNPFKEHDRLYRTGDLGYWLPDGNIAFVERIDTQVKVRGFRVELGEIEYQMRTHHAVKEAVVLARQTTVGTKELIAYYVGAQSHGSESLRTYLAQLLPEYMVPYHIIQLERFPLTVNGKIDRQALPAPESIILHPDKTEEQPCNETQALLIQVLESVLGRKVRLQDNYFDLGGDSIRAIQIVNRLKQAGWHLEISDLFQKPTPVALSPYLRKTERQKNLEIISGPVRLTPIQHWFFKEHDIDLHHFNQSVLLQARERIDETALRSVLDKLQQHHDGLRMTYRQVGDKIEQVNAEDLPLEFMVKDLRDNPQEDALASMEAHANWLQRSFNLETGPLMKTVLYHLDQRDLLLMVIHHLVVDGLSWRILMEDLEKGYSQYLQGQEKAIDLGSKSTSFKAWASEQYAVAEAVLQEQKDYWSSKAGIETKPIPKDIGEGYNLYGDCLTVGTDLSYEQTKALLTGINHAYNTEINDILLTALGRALKVCYGKDKTWITMEGHGRLSLGEKPVDISRTVGWFTSVYPFLLTISGEDIGAHLKEVKEALREVPHQGVGFGILRYLSSQDLPLPPQPQVSFNYLGQFDQGGETDFFTFADDGPTGQSISPRFKRHHELDVSGIIFGNRLYLSILFSQGGHYHQDQMQILLSLFKEELLSVIKHCQNKKEREKTPSDFTERAFTLESYASFLESHCWKAWDIEDIYTLSPMQEGLLFQSLYEPHSKAYFLQMAFRVEEELHPELFKRSWDILVNRHPILRTAFVHEGLPRPLQVVFKHRSPEILFVDLQGLSKDEKRIKEYENQDMARGFDLERDPLMRITLLRLDTSLYHVVWSYHHIVLDGWSLGIVYREFTLIYKALINGKEPVLPAVPPYSDYIRWLKRQDKAVAKAYWLRYLFGYEQHVQLPRSLSARASGYSLKEMNFELSDRTSAALIELAARHKVTLNTIIQALWGLLLSRYNNIDDVVFGMIVSGRPSEVKGIEEMVGLFINALPVRIHYRPDQSFAALVQEEVQHSFIEGTSYHHLSLSEIQTLVPAGRELFDHLLIFENYPLDQGMGQGGEEDLNFTGLSVHDETHYDFNLIVIPGRPIQIRMSYNSLVYTPEEIEGIGVHLKTAIHSVLEDPAKVLSKIDIVPEKEKEQVLYGFNKTDVVCPKDKTIVDVFEAQVQQTPNAVAVVFENTSLTYHELNRWANAIAHYLREAHFLQPDDRVGLMVERSEAVVAAIFGILKAGGAYIPLDPDYPQERIRYILQDAQCAVILSEPKYIKLLSIHDSAPVIDLYHIDHANRGNPSRTVALENLAYVIYTSGSTGRPKGCQIEHGNLFHYLSWAARYYFLDNPESGYFALYSSLSFDLTVTSLFLPLLRGKTLYIFPQDMDLNDILLKNFSDNTPIDCIKLTPSHISLMKQINLSSTNIGLVIVGGESLLMEQVRLLQGLNPHMKIYNEYGPTETTVGCIVKHVRPQDQRVLIGKPIDNTHIYILDSHGWPVPLGVVGEIYIGGSGVCRGYLNQQWLNEERFITSPFVRGERLYKTGDLGRWLADGNIECLGRNDNQIKIRGYRIELEEIEQAIVEHEAVQKAVVLPLPDIRQKDKALVAYVVVDNEKLNSQKLRDYLKAMLPDYMIPSYFVKLDEIPLTPHGKVDKKALPDPVQEHLESRMAYVEPRNLLEKRLSQVWQSVLDVERIGIEDNFFELGGHSLKAMQIVSRIHKELGVKIGLKDFFNVPTVAQLAGLIMNQERIDSLKGIEPAPRQPYYELSHAQKRLWLLYRMKGEVAYNMPNAVLLEDTVDTEALDMAFHTIIERHEALRTGFIEVESEPKQVIHPDIVFTVKKIDLSGGAEAEKRGHAIADIEANTPFDLTKPPLLRATLIKLGEKRYVFLLTMHHIVGDGWSMNILYHELLALYEAYCLKKPNPLKPLRIQYKDFALWQNARGFDQEQKYWLSKLAGMPESLPLPYDFLPEEERSFHGDTKAIELDKDSVKQLQALAAKKNTTLSNVMLAIFKLFLFQLTRQHDMCIGISIANRNHPELENIIGFFVNILPIRTYLSEDMEFGELLDQVIQNTYEAFEHQDYPFDLLIQKLNPTRYANRQPIVNVIYGFQNFADVHIDIGDNDLRVKEKYFDPSMAFDFSFKTSKFDLTLFVFQEEDEALHLTLEYDTSLFLSKTIEQYLSILKRLANMLANQVTHGQVS